VFFSSLKIPRQADEDIESGVKRALRKEPFGFQKYNTERFGLQRRQISVDGILGLRFLIEHQAIADSELREDVFWPTWIWFQFAPQTCDIDSERA
jgi:hypothetical protein